MRKTTTAFMATAFILMASMVFAQGESKPVKVAVVDFLRVTMESVKGKEIQASFESQATAMANALQQEQQQLQRELADLENQRTVLSEEAFTNRRNDLEQRTLAFRQKQTKAQNDLQRLQQTETQKFLEFAAPVIEEIGKEMDLTLIIDANTQGLYYFDTAIEITDEVKKRLDAKAPAQGGN